MSFSLLFLANVVILAASDGYICAGGTLRNPPADLNEPYYYPENWNEAKPLAKYNASQTCNWQINVPHGMYATVSFYKFTQDLDDGIFCTYPNGKVFSLLDNDTAPFIFTSPQFQIDLRANDNEEYFSFKVVWSFYPEKICRNDVLLENNELIPSGPSDCMTMFTAPTRVLLVGFMLADLPIESLRLSAVYEGDSVNGTYLGNLYDANNVNIRSQQNKMTVFLFGFPKIVNHTIFIGMDVQAAGDVEIFTGLDCSSLPSTRCDLEIDSQSEVNAVITASRDVDYIKATVPHLPNYIDLKVYEGKMDNDHLLAIVNQSNYYYTFPMAVKNSVKIYKLDRGSWTFALDKNPGDAAYSTVFVERYVNIHSFDIGQMSYYQDTIENFTTGSPDFLINFNFNVKFFDVNGPTTLDITVFKSNNMVFHERYFRGNMPPLSAYQILGDSMTVSYQTYGVSTKGFEVELTCIENDETLTSTMSSSVAVSTFSSTRPIISTTTTQRKTETTMSYETTTKGADPNFLFSFVLFIFIVFTML